jgi:glycosyltransferase involved in cell wall biosynthesis
MDNPAQFADSSSLRLTERLTVLRRLWLARVREYLQFDSRVTGFVAAWAAVLAAFVFSLVGKNRRALDFLTWAHRSGRSSSVRRLAERVLAAPVVNDRPSLNPRVAAAYDEYLTSITSGTGHLHPSSLIGARLLVLKSPAENERGVIVIDYTYVFPLFARFCDLEALSKRYYIVLEPSWVGYCTPEILVYSRIGEPVFVQTNEPPDGAFLKRISPNLVQVPIVSNWWIDHRIMRPIPGVAKDIDVAMVAGWAQFKRHGRFFAALARLRRKGTRLKVLLIGYPVDGSLTREELYLQAKYFGISDQLEIHEHLEPERVALHLNRSKIHVLWSRREGSNKAIIEAMLADLPGILWEGYNYGYHYPYINPQTGRFASEKALPETMTSMIEHLEAFAPRAWIMAHMTPQIATSILAGCIRTVAIQRGEAWRSDLVVKAKALNNMSYWDPDDAPRFAADYAYIRSIMKP